MGGNHLGVGNVTTCAEFNFWFDPEAAHIVVNEIFCPLFILPFEPTVKASLKMPHKNWRFSVLNSIESEFMNVLDLVEKNVDYRGTFIPCDAFLIACFCFPNMITKIRKHAVSVELSGNFTRGQMILDHRREEEENAFIIEEMDARFFKKLLCWVAGHEIEIFE